MKTISVIERTNALDTARLLSAARVPIIHSVFFSNGRIKMVMGR